MAKTVLNVQAQQSKHIFSFLIQKKKMLNIFFVGLRGFWSTGQPLPRKCRVSLLQAEEKNRFSACLQRKSKCHVSVNFQHILKMEIAGWFQQLL